MPVCLWCKKRTFDFMSNYNSRDTIMDANGKWKTSYSKGTTELNVNEQFDNTKTDLTDSQTSRKLLNNSHLSISFTSQKDRLAICPSLHAA